MSFDPFGVLSLRDTEPLIEGARRRVYQHPGHERLLIKVLQPAEATFASTQKVPLRIRRRYGIYRTYTRQIDEYIRLRARLRDEDLPIERFFGVVDTDFGLGLVVEKVVDRAGRLAPTLDALVTRHGLSPGLEERILRLRDEVLRLGIITGDLHGGNIVAGHDAARGDRLVIVDGIGTKTFIPVNSLSRYINRRSNLRHFDHVLRRLKVKDAGRAASAPEAAGPGAPPKG